MKIEVEFKPRGSDDKKPYIAGVVGDGFAYYAEASTPSEALLLVAAHWHSRADLKRAQDNSRNSERKTNV